MDGVLSQAAEGRIKLASDPDYKPSWEAAPAAVLQDADFRRVQKMIYDHCGIVLGPQKREMVTRRLARRLKALNLANYKDYLNYVKDSPAAEFQDFCNALTTNLTAFYREPHHFVVLAKYLQEQKNSSRVRVWCAAASTGEEPYSIAMTACKAFRNMHPPVDILATDIDTQVLKTAAQGVYAEERIEALETPERRKFFFRGQGENLGKVRVRPELQSLIQFKQKNLLEDDYKIQPGLDVVFLRNVMIYFDRAGQRHIVERMHRLLKPEGLLIVGHSENLFHAQDLFRSLGQTVYIPLGSR
nr:chemotaxis protein CheR [Oceanococcus sp. HetDA_MAG_MS8]